MKQSWQGSRGRMQSKSGVQEEKAKLTPFLAKITPKLSRNYPETAHDFPHLTKLFRNRTPSPRNQMYIHADALDRLLPPTERHVLPTTPYYNGIGLGHEVFCLLSRSSMSTHFLKPYERCGFIRFDQRPGWLLRAEAHASVSFPDYP